MQHAQKYAASTPKRAYATPTVAALGTLVDLTAGPDNGNIDQMVGGAGGFQALDPS